jgi:hypothetical protein
MKNVTVCERLVALSVMNSVIMLGPIMVLQHGDLCLFYSCKVIHCVPLIMSQNMTAIRGALTQEKPMSTGNWKSRILTTHFEQPFGTKLFWGLSPFGLQYCQVSIQLEHKVFVFSHCPALNMPFKIFYCFYYLYYSLYWFAPPCWCTMTLSNIFSMMHTLQKYCIHMLSAAECLSHTHTHTHTHFSSAVWHMTHYLILI